MHSQYPQLLNRKEASCYLGISTATLAARACQGLPPSYIKIGKSVRYKKDVLDQFLIDNTVEYN